MASKLWVHEPDTFFLQGDTEISDKRNFFVNHSVPENFQREIFLGQAPTESLCTQDSEYVYERGVEDFFYRVLPAQSWEMPVEREVPAGLHATKLYQYIYAYMSSLHIKGWLDSI